MGFIDLLRIGEVGGSPAQQMGHLLQGESMHRVVWLLQTKNSPKVWIIVEGCQCQEREWAVG